MKSAWGLVAAGTGAMVVLIALAWSTASRTTRTWFENDLALRAEMAVSIARSELIQGIETQDVSAVAQILETISNDERILGAAICGSDKLMLGMTPLYPNELSCSLISRRLARGSDLSTARRWRGTLNLRQGPVHVGAFSLAQGTAHPTGFVVVVHDLGYAERREARAQLFLAGVFTLLAMVAISIAVPGVRLLWRRWNLVLRQIAQGRGENSRPEFVPLIQDLRDLLDRLALEEQGEQQGRRWNADRLRLTLRRHLHGERLIVAANREPYIHERADDGTLRVLHPASGLVSALEPVLRACSGVWIAHGAGSADRETVDARDHIRVPPGEESYRLRRLWLTAAEERGYYYGFSNEGLWPLCHVAHARPTFRADDWRHYQLVNKKFADAIVQESDSDDPVVLVQDYHFALVPSLLRQRLPRATILTFWHIPWPNAEQLSICPWHAELIEGLLGSSILGFHTQLHCNNFLEAADRFLEARLDREDFAIVRQNRRTLVRPYPISVEWPNRWAASAPPPSRCRSEVYEELGLATDCRLGLGVDRLDYTKGIEERFRAIERLFEREPHWIGRFTFLQIASPSRTTIERYARLEGEIVEIARRINERFSTGAWKPIELRRQHTEPADVFRFYRAADLCYVSSLHDGMNLVAKEFLAARDDACGVLVLSRFTGAARELTQALIVNPYDIEESSHALSVALRMPLDEQRVRVSAMRQVLAERNIYRWAGRMLMDASRLRRGEAFDGTVPLDAPDVRVLSAGSSRRTMKQRSRA